MKTANRILLLGAIAQLVAALAQLVGAIRLPP
jgi:hypothetical protein